MLANLAINIHAAANTSFQSIFVVVVKLFLKIMPLLKYLSKETRI
jgi:hypothetical protein